jgi:hypothetical protein
MENVEAQSCRDAETLEKTIQESKLKSPRATANSPARKPGQVDRKRAFYFSRTMYHDCATFIEQLLKVSLRFYKMPKLLSYLEKVGPKFVLIVTFSK